MFQLLTRLRPFRGGTIPFGLLGALSFMACGARSAHVPPTRDAAPIVRRDLSSVVDIAPSKDSPSRPDGPPPIDAPRPPASWQDLPIHSLGHIEIHDIRGLSDDEVWLAGQGSTAGSAEVWALDGHVFRPVGGPKTPYPLQSIWAQRSGNAKPTLWVVGKRTEASEGAIWSRRSGNTWTPAVIAQPGAMDLVAVDGSETGEVFAVGNTGTHGLALHYAPTSKRWTLQLFSDAFLSVETRDVAVGASGVAYAIGQRASRARFWLFRDAVWHLDQGLAGVGKTLCVARHPKGTDDIYAGGDRLWFRSDGDWLPLDGPTALGGVQRLRAHGDTLFLITAKRVWRQDTPGRWHGRALPDAAEPGALWVSGNWVWVASTKGRAWRHHLQTF